MGERVEQREDNSCGSNLGSMAVKVLFPSAGGQGMSDFTCVLSSERGGTGRLTGLPEMIKGGMEEATRGWFSGQGKEVGLTKRVVMGIV